MLSTLFSANYVNHPLGFWLLLGMAGGAGTLVRYGAGVAAATIFGSSFPWGTLIVNTVGCFLFGLVAETLSSTVAPSAARVMLLTGFLGGLTTFSAFAFDNEQFLLQRQWVPLAANVALQNVLGVIAVCLGAALANVIIGTKP